MRRAEEEGREAGGLVKTREEIEKSLRYLEEEASGHERVEDGLVQIAHALLRIDDAVRALTAGLREDLGQSGEPDGSGFQVSGL